jgi:4-diphosphocytidyl-2-C-methyl-D-erythritol kinase
MFTETAYAKINLALHVRRRRDDGYHDLETMFAFCEDGDVVSAAPADTLSLTITGPYAHGLSATDNLVIRAAQAMGATARLHLVKNLPIASGIGGGSADAGATLRALSNMLAKPLPDLAVQRELGADVPACVASRTLRGASIGDVLSEGCDVAGAPVLLVNPSIPLSTAKVFAAWDGIDRGPLGDWQAGRNDLETSARLLVPAIGDLLNWLNAQPGVTCARMSGSGATCFALFERIEQRRIAADAVRAAFPGCWHLQSVLR